MDEPSTGKVDRPSVDLTGSDFTGRTVFLSEAKDYKFLRGAKLVVIKGTDSGGKLEMDKERVVLGRSSICDLVLKDGSISGLHCEVVAEEKGHLLRDLGSTNGIFMLGHRVRELFLRPGSEFQIGNDLIRYEVLESVVKIPLSSRGRFGTALGTSVKMREIFALLEKVSTSDLPILLRGETGTGKELLSFGVHTYSFRKNRPFVVLDCGAVPADTIESTLFGHVKGAFTGAVENRQGVFEEAHRGTLFLDEVAELDLALQPKLLRVLQQQEVQRVGGIKPVKVDVRIVAATHRDLRDMVDRGRFREDLFYRLSVVEVEIPPLRERPEDIPLLVEHFLAGGNHQREKQGLPPVRLSKDAVLLLQSHAWPGNVRELRNVIDRAIQLAERVMIKPRDLHLDRSQGGRHTNLAIDCRQPYKHAKALLNEQFERHYLMRLMSELNGNLSAASRKAGLARHHLRNLCRKYGIPCGADS